MASHPRLISIPDVYASGVEGRSQLLYTFEISFSVAGGVEKHHFGGLKS